MIKHCFIVTSAINSKFGVYKPEERLEQTVATINSIKGHIPDAMIVVMECCGTPPTEEQVAVLKQNSDIFYDYSRDPDVVALYDNDNWDIVKNGTEIMCFGRVLQALKDSNALEGIDRVHKMSGRYILNDKFVPALYENDQVKDKIVIGPKVQSQFPVAITNQPWQYMARLWNWPNSMTNDVIDVYNNSLMFFAERLSVGGYVDIEHVLARFLPQDHVLELEQLGVEGNIAPNGHSIKN